MSKIPYKVLAVSTLIAVTAASNALPIQVLAQEQTVQVQNNKENKYTLGPEGVREALILTGSNSLVMDLYAKTIIKQPNVDLSNMPLGKEGEDLTKKIHSNQATARVNANHWLDNLKPNVKKTAYNIINYDTKFQAYYDDLVAAAREKNKSSFQEGIEDLLESLTGNANEVDRLITELQGFKDKLTLDTNALKINLEGPNGLLAILGGENAVQEQLQKQIESLKLTQKEHHKSYIAWAAAGGTVSAVLGIGAIVGVVAIVVTGGVATPIVVGVAATAVAAATLIGVTAGFASEQLSEYNAVSDKIIELTEKSDKAGKAIISLTGAKEQIKDLSDTIDQAISSLGQIKKQWDTMASNYTVLSDSVETIEPQNFSMVIEDLVSAQQQWKDIRHDAELIAKDIVVAENQSK